MKRVEQITKTGFFLSNFCSTSWDLPASYEFIIMKLVTDWGQNVYYYFEPVEDQSDSPRYVRFHDVEQPKRKVDPSTLTVCTKHYDGKVSLIYSYTDFLELEFKCVENN